MRQNTATRPSARRAPARAKPFRRILRRTPARIEYVDPLATAWLVAQVHPVKAERRALRRLLHDLAAGQNAETGADAVLHNGTISSLTAALLEARKTGRYSDDEWRRAALP